MCLDAYTHFGTHLPCVSYSDQPTNGVKGSCSTDKQMGLVVMLQDLDVVCALRLLEDIQRLSEEWNRVGRKVGGEGSLGQRKWCD